MILLGWLMFAVAMTLVAAICFFAAAMLRRLAQRTGALEEIIARHDPKHSDSHDPPDYWEGLCEAADIAREALGLPLYWEEP